MSVQSPNTRLVRLDGVRGLAVLAVLLFHAGPFLVPSVAPNLLPGGFLGVDLFFVLSGFLMTSILRDPSRSFGRFYVRRVARIFPALYVLLAVNLIYATVTHTGWMAGSKMYGLIALGLGNWGSTLGVVLPFSLGQTWSLGLEEQLYLVWPLVMVLIVRHNPRVMRFVCVAGIAGSLVFKLAMFRSGMPADHIYMQTPGRLDDFLVGALVATAWQDASARPGARPFRGLGVLSVLSVGYLGWCLSAAHPYASGWLYEGGFTAVAASCGILVYACLYEVRGTGLCAWAPLRAAGRYSYAVYLWHPFLFIVLDRSLPHNTPVRALAEAGLVGLISVVSTRVVEEPLRRLAQRPKATAPRSRPARITVVPAG
jgi:peptidoglycan/LPS O-acetylase OafA/YrhL